MYTKHGHSSPVSREYAAWSSMKDRCLNKRHRQFNQYGGRGISVCSRWLRFENFYSDMGQRPEGEFSLERINNDEDYGPENCKWATVMEQSLNKRTTRWIVYGGGKINIKSFASMCHISHSSVSRRIEQGWSLDEIRQHYNAKALKAGNKRCSKCFELKPIDRFVLYSESRDERGASCKDCHNLINKQYRASKKATGGLI